MKQNDTQLKAEIQKRALHKLLEGAKEFYKDPKNRQAYEAWKKSKEAQIYANYINS